MNFKLKTLYSGMLFCAAAAAALPGAALAQAYPNKAVQVIVPLGTGGGADRIGRQISEALAKRWGQPVVVINRPGAGTMLGLTSVANSAPDGYTLGITTQTIAVLHLLTRDMTFKVLEDFRYLSLLSDTDYVLASPATLPPRSMREFIAYAQANPGKLNYASAGPGAVTLIAADLMQRGKITLVDIPYKSSAEMSMALLAGDAHLTIEAPLNVKTHADAGKLIPLMTTGTQRMAIMPNVPTAAEAGLPGLEFSSWYGLIGPAKLPDPIVSKISADVNAILKDPAVADPIRIQAGGNVRGGEPASFRAFVEKQVAQNNTLAQRIGMKPQ